MKIHDWKPGALRGLFVLGLLAFIGCDTGGDCDDWAELNGGGQLKADEIDGAETPDPATPTPEPEGGCG